MSQINYKIDKFLIIDSLPLFSGLSPLQKHFINARTQLVTFEKGGIVYNKGDKPDYFYCMVSGRVQLYHPQGAGKVKERLIECVRRGDYFGSISSLTGKAHTVSAKALNDTVALRISTGDFNYILRKIPHLAIRLSHSLSRRLGRKTHKEIFESKIIAIYDLDRTLYSFRYANALAEGLRKESGKKVCLSKSSSIKNKRNVSSKLSSLTKDNHYVLVDISGNPTDINFEILKQSDFSHIISSSDKESLRETASFVRKLEKSISNYKDQAAFVIVKEDRFYDRISHKYKAKILKKDIFATLPEEKARYNKTIRRIAREVSGVRVGLVLGSGAAMGLAHIGVLEVLEKEKISIDIMSGTSMGALIGTLWAVGYSAREIEKLACSFKSKLRTLFLIDPTVPIRGLIKGRAVKKILKSYLGNKTFFDTRFPLKVVACDIKNRREIIIEKGKLIDAVMASIAIPGVFEPIEINDAQLVDGGIVNPVPISVLTKSGIKRIIAVNTLPSAEDMVRISHKKLNIYDIIVNSFQAMEYTIAQYSCRQADILLNPIPEIADWYEFYKAELFIKTGRNQTRAILSKIKKLAKSSDIHN